MKNKDLYLRSVEHCKKISPIMDKLNIEPDGWHRSIANDDWFFTSREDQDPTKLTTDHCINVPTWRQDKLGSVLPDANLVYKKFKEQGITRFSGDVETNLVIKYERLIDKIVSFKGEPKRQATVELVCLLKAENLIPSNKGELELVCPDCCKPIKGYAKCGCEL